MFYIFIITILTGIDQWTKYLIETQLKPIGAIPIVRYIPFDLCKEYRSSF